MNNYETHFMYEGQQKFSAAWSTNLPKVKKNLKQETS